MPVVTVSLPPPPPFDYDDESRATAGTRWPQWLRDFGYFVSGSGITDKTQKLSVFLHVVGSRTSEIYETLKKPDDDYDAAVKALETYFAPFKNIEFEVFKFGQMVQTEFESLDDYIVRLRLASRRCEFGNDEDKEIKRRIVSGCRSVGLREYIFLNPDVTLTQIQTKSRALSTTNVQAKFVGEATSNKPTVKLEPVCAVSSKASGRGGAKGKALEPDHAQSGERECFACGYEFPHKGECPAKGRRCKKCNVEGHFASSRYCKKEKKLNTMRTEFSEEEKGYLFANSSKGSNRPFVNAELSGAKVDLLVDSGADENILNESTFKSIERLVCLRPTTRSVFAYGESQPIPFLGEFTSEVSVSGVTVLAHFFVASGKQYNLLSFETARVLRVFQSSLFRVEAAAVPDQRHGVKRGRPVDLDLVCSTMEMGESVFGGCSYLGGRGAKFKDFLGQTVPATSSRGVRVKDANDAVGRGTQGKCVRSKTNERAHAERKRRAKALGVKFKGKVGKIAKRHVRSHLKDKMVSAESRTGRVGAVT